MIGIISAMQEEVEALLQALQNVSTRQKGQRTYFEGILFGKPVVIVFSRWGKVAAAATTTQLLNDFPVREVLFTGVAGAIQPDINIGDIVVGKQLYQHDLDARPFYQQFEIPILQKKHLVTSQPQALEMAANTFVKKLHNYLSDTEAAVFGIRKPKVYIGDIASGDQFISSRDKIRWLNQQLPSAICAEMEGAAVAQICHEYKLPFNIIRIISDKANDNAGIDFPRFAKSIASNYALGILAAYLSTKS